MEDMIPFNKPSLVGSEVEYIKMAIETGKISGNGIYTKKCQQYFQKEYNIHKALLTTSCTDALEMTALLMNIEEGDEIIMPSFTFVSTAIAFVRQKAKIIFADSRSDNPNMDASQLERHITNKTKAIVVVHYAGVACDMEEIMRLASKHNLFVVEDAAQAIESFYKDRPLGSIGDFGTFSFHETKNINCGEGGLLAVNNKLFCKRSEIIWEKGTNRTAFFRGEVDKYGWVDTGSSFLPSEISASFLYAQIEQLDKIQKKRIALWKMYFQGLLDLQLKGVLKLPVIPNYATNNGHIFYIIANNENERDKLLEFLKTNKVYAVFHYLTLHTSTYYTENLKCSQEIELKYAKKYANCLIRLPLFYELKFSEVNYVIDVLKSYYK